MLDSMGVVGSVMMQKNRHTWLWECVSQILSAFPYQLMLGIVKARVRVRERPRGFGTVLVHCTTAPCGTGRAPPREFPCSCSAATSSPNRRQVILTASTSGFYQYSASCPDVRSSTSSRSSTLTMLRITRAPPRLQGVWLHVASSQASVGAHS